MAVEQLTAERRDEASGAQKTNFLEDPKLDITSLNYISS